MQRDASSETTEQRIGLGCSKKRIFAEGERVLCYDPNPTRLRVLYDAKILRSPRPRLDSSCNGDAASHNSDCARDSGLEYYIHFLGWSSSWDRYISDELLLEDNENNRKLQAQLNAEAKKLILERRKKQRRSAAAAYRTTPAEARAVMVPEGSDDNDNGVDFARARTYRSLDADHRATNDLEIDTCCTASEVDVPVCDAGHDIDSRFLNQICAAFPLQLPDSLRQRLLNDRLQIKAGRLHNLPCKLDIVTILEDYVEHFAFQLLNGATAPLDARLVQPCTTKVIAKRQYHNSRLSGCSNHQRQCSRQSLTDQLLQSYELCSYETQTVCSFTAPVPTKPSTAKKTSEEISPLGAGVKACSERHKAELELCKETVDGLRILFNSICNRVLLYAEEQAQFEALSHIRSEADARLKDYNQADNCRGFAISNRISANATDCSSRYGCGISKCVLGDEIKCASEIPPTKRLQIHGLYDNDFTVDSDQSKDSNRCSSDTESEDMRESGSSSLPGRRVRRQQSPSCYSSVAAARRNRGELDLLLAQLGSSFIGKKLPQAWDNASHRVRSLRLSTQHASIASGTLRRNTKSGSPEHVGKLSAVTCNVGSSPARLRRGVLVAGGENEPVDPKDDNFCNQALKEGEDEEQQSDSATITSWVSQSSPIGENGPAAKDPLPAFVGASYTNDARNGYMITPKWRMAESFSHYTQSHRELYSTVVTKSSTRNQKTVPITLTDRAWPPPAQVYGAHHLLRLLSQLPLIVPLLRMPQCRAEVLLKQLRQLVEYLACNDVLLFGDVNEVSRNSADKDDLGVSRGLRPRRRKKY